MKKRSSFFCFACLVILVALCGAAILAWRHYKNQKHELKNLLTDDTLYDKEIRNAANKHGLPPELVRAVIKQESRFQNDKVGEAGEIGLMQILPRGAAAEWARVNKCPMPSSAELKKVEVNLDIGCWYLARAMKRYQEYRYCTELALADYNAGTRNASRWKPADKNGEMIHLIDFPTTRKYVTEIMHNYREYLIAAKR